MTRRAWLPAAGLSLYLCLVLWMQRTGGSQLSSLDLLGSCLAAMFTVLVGWLASGRLTRDTDRRGLIALMVGLWGLLFGTFQVLSEPLLGEWFQSQLIAAASWTLLCGGLCWLISRGASPLAFVTRALGIATIILLGTQSVQAMQRLLSERAHDETAHEAVTGRRNEKTPDVFVFLLDKYSSGAWLSHTYGVNQRPFEDSLRALGFVVPTAARSNYAHTYLSLASFLNGHLLETGDGQPALSWSGMRERVDHARTWEVFRRNGYRVIHFPTTFPATRTIAGADVELRRAPHLATRFAETWLLNSPLASWIASSCWGHTCANGGATPYPIETLDDIEWKLATVRSLPDSAGPLIAFVHLLSPHEPYLFESNCSGGVPWWPLTDQGSDFDRIGVAYGIQVTCLDRMLLRTVRALLERPGVRPVIVLQADHGHGRITVDPMRGFTLSDKELSPDRLGERFGVFAAYLFPGADTAVYNDISAVNVMPLVLRSIFGTVASRQPDRSFWSTHQDAFNFTEIDPALTRPPELRAGTEDCGQPGCVRNLRKY
jgi:hypothetical protein